MFSSLAFCWRASLTSRNLPWRYKATSRALRSSLTTVASSPAAGIPERPKISTGIEGPADLMSLPFSSRIARIRPYSRPHNTMSPWLSVPDWTSIDATGPRPLSKRDSITTPAAIPTVGAVSSSSSDWFNTASKSSSIPKPVFAEIWTYCVSPPHSSGITSSWASSFLTRSGSTPSLSILFTAMIKGTPAARACCTASLVCGITPSSAATTKITISVAWAPRARIEVNAAWPGVSKKVIMLPLTSTWYAPMCCVIPPASPEATLAERM